MIHELMQMMQSTNPLSIERRIHDANILWFCCDLWSTKHVWESWIFFTQLLTTDWDDGKGVHSTNARIAHGRHIKPNPIDCEFWMEWREGMFARNYSLRWHRVLRQRQRKSVFVFSRQNLPNSFYPTQVSAWVESNSSAKNVLIPIVCHPLLL